MSSFLPYHQVVSMRLPALPSLLPEWISGIISQHVQRRGGSASLSRKAILQSHHQRGVGGGGLAKAWCRPDAVLLIYWSVDGIHFCTKRKCGLIPLRWYYVSALGYCILLATWMRSVRILLQYLPLVGFTCCLLIESTPKVGILTSNTEETSWVACSQLWSMQ